MFTATQERQCQKMSSSAGHNKGGQDVLTQTWWYHMSHVSHFIHRTCSWALSGSSCCLVTFKKSRGHLPLMNSGCYQDSRSLISSFSRCSKMAAMSNSRPWGNAKCQNPYLGEGTLSQFPVGAPPPPPPPWGLTLIGA